MGSDMGGYMQRELANEEVRKRKQDKRDEFERGLAVATAIAEAGSVKAYLLTCEAAKRAALEKKEAAAEREKAARLAFHVVQIEMVAARGELERADAAARLAIEHAREVAEMLP